MHIRIVIILLGIGMFLPTPPAHAAGVVGDGTPASCTRDALATALASGGEIRFNCGSAPVTIPIAATLDIRTAATIDGGGLVTLDGQGTTRIMYVNKLSAGTTLTLRNLTLANGRSSGFESSFGGCVYARQSAVDLIDVTFTGCRAGNGAALYVYGGALKVERSTFIGNHASDGGAIYALQGGRVVIRNSTFLVNVTLVRNQSANGANLNWERTTTMTLRNTLLVPGSNGRNCIRAVSTSEGGNIQEGDTSCFPSQPVVALGLSAPAMHGGATPTIALPPGAAAIDVGRDCPPFDQRGFPRVGACDSGAFEFGSSAPNLSEAVFLPLVVR